MHGSDSAIMSLTSCFSSLGHFSMRPSEVAPQSTSLTNFWKGVKVGGEGVLSQSKLVRCVIEAGWAARPLSPGRGWSPTCCGTMRGSSGGAKGTRWVVLGRGRMCDRNGVGETVPQPLMIIIASRAGSLGRPHYPPGSLCVCV